MSEDLDEQSRYRPGLPVVPIQEATDSLLQVKFSSLKPPHIVDSNDHTESILSHTEDMSYTEDSTAQSFRESAGEAARKAISDRMANSKITNNFFLEIPEFDIKEFALGKRLGKGSFSDVDEIRAIMLQMDTAITPPNSPCCHDSIAVDDKESRQFIAAHCTRSSGDSRYALKTLRRDSVNDEKRLVLGLCDLAMEVRFLSGLTHPHIIKLRAVSSASEYSSDFFLVLDRLCDTLAKRLRMWQSRKKHLKTWLGRFVDRRGMQGLEFYEDRIERAYDVSAALEYCHSKNIIHRDVVSTARTTLAELGWR